MTLRGSALLLVALLTLGLALAACGVAEDVVDEATGEADADGSDEDEADGERIRIMADFPPPPFNAAVAIEEFGDILAEEVPGTSLEAHFAGSLYPSEAEALEAMQAGNLEMIFGQYGKAGDFEPTMNIVTQPYNFTTVGAMRNFPGTETADYLAERMEERGIKILGNAHLSFLLAIGAPERITSPEDIAGQSVRSMDPLVGNAVLAAWGANPTTMAFGETPSALETGTLDAVATSVGGWLTVRDQAPYYNVLGIGGVTTDLYYVGVNEDWWNGLDDETRSALEDLIPDLTERSDEITYCDDQAAIDEFGTEDPDEEGLYWLEDDEIAEFEEMLGDAPAEALKDELDEDVHEWVDRIAEEGQELSEEHPEGSDSLEETDCDAIAEEYDR